MARKGGSRGGLALWGFALVVAALIVSWGWNTFGPHHRGARRSGKHVVRVQVLNGSGEPGVGTRVAALGTVVGALAAWLASGLMAGLLHGVTPHDPATFGLTASALMAAAVAACWLPARRAAAVHPMEAIRAE